jgi:CubicO group peptidase (beta-lactamase class C family)
MYRILFSMIRRLAPLAVVATVVLVAIAGCTDSKATPPSADAPATAPTRSPLEARVVTGLRPKIAITGEAPVRWMLAERMAHYHVPAVSIAVIDSGRVAWAAAFGLKQVGGTDSVTPETMFEAGSVSKPTFDVGVMRLVQDGRLSLDDNVNDKLQSWKVPDNKFTTHEKVTLRRIMSHNAGLTVHGFPGYEAGAPVPTVLQVLNGEKPANTAPVRVDTIPGAISRYSGGGLTVAMLLVTDVTKQPLPAFMRLTVFDPIGMTHSTYEQPLPPSLAPNAASGHTITGNAIPGKYHTYPEMSAAGLWSTPTDLAKLAIELQRAYTGRSRTVLDQSTVREMFTVQKPPFGLGYVIDGSGPAVEFSHSGDDAGFKAITVAFAERGQGAVIMSNGDLGDALMQEILTSIADAYNWPTHRQAEKRAVPHDSASLAAFVGTYRLDVGMMMLDTVTLEHGKLFMRSGDMMNKVEILADTDATFYDRWDGTKILFDRDKKGRVVGLTVPGVVSGPKVP